MKQIITLLFVTFATLALAADAGPPNKYSLSVGRVYESKPERPEWVFIVGGTSAIRGGETVCKSACDSEDTSQRLAAWFDLGLVADVLWGV